MTTRHRLRKLMLLVGLAGGALLAGDGRCDEVAYQVWIDYNPKWKKGENWSFYGDAGVRRNFEDPLSWRYVLRPNIGYDFGSWTLTGGIGNFYTDFAGELRLYELRPWQGALVYWPDSGFRLSHFFRLEEQFFFDADASNSLFKFRFRYQLGTRVNWTNSTSGRGWNSPLSIEAFFTFDRDEEERFGEEARITAGIARVFSPNVRVEFDLLWQSTARLTDILSEREVFFRFRIFQNF